MTTNDGCWNGHELDDLSLFGGNRDPDHFWDFYDAPDDNNIRDKVVTILAILRVLARFGADDDGGAAPINRNTDPLSVPPPAPVYHPAFDRGAVDTGQGPWHHAAADGVIDLPNDIVGVLEQFRTDCN